MIIHADMDAYYAAVEQRDNKALRGRPVVVGGAGRRGVVATCSYEARVYGIRSAMSGASAQRLCPQAVFIAPRMNHYADISRQIHDVFERYTPMIEPIALDEAFLDVQGSLRLFGGAEAIATRIRADIYAKTQLTVSVGIAKNKFVAKVASDESKPDGLIAVAQGTEAEFLKSLSIARIWGAGSVAQGRMRHHGFNTIGDLQAASLARLQLLFGDAAGLHYHRLSFGRDRRRVGTRAAQSFSHETTFAYDVQERDECHRVLFGLSERVARRLRQRNQPCRLVRIKLRYPDFKTVTRQRRLLPTNDDVALFRTARQLFDDSWSGVSLRLLGVVAEVGGECAQTDLFSTTRIGLINALDQIKDKHGDRSIGYAGALRVAHRGEGG